MSWLQLAILTSIKLRAVAANLAAKSHQLTRNSVHSPNNRDKSEKLTTHTTLIEVTILLIKDIKLI